VRPLLEVTRAETFQFCQEQQLAIWEDAYNQDLKYARNRIRQELIPYLKSHFNPQVETALSQTAELLRADVAYLEDAAQELRQQAMAPVKGEEQDALLESCHRASPTTQSPGLTASFSGSATPRDQAISGHGSTDRS
jgi:tRNA(Ile)-lysidine synthase